jgi:hypothetical protein
VLHDIYNPTANEIEQKNQLATDTARWISDEVELSAGPIDFQTALVGARFAILWKDEFDFIINRETEHYNENPEEVIEIARRRADLRADRIPDYKSELPEKAKIASWFAFSYLFEDEAPQIFRLLASPTTEIK